MASRFEVMERGHAERLPVMVDELFQETAVAPTALARIVVTRGPGTFTGLRIGLAYAKGLGLALSKPVTGIDTLFATAMAHRGKAQRLLIAHRAGGTGQCYTALFDGRTLAPLRPPALLPPEQAGVGAEPALVVGTAAAAVTLLHPGLALAQEDHLPNAALFGAAAVFHPHTDNSDAPYYLREADAKPSVSPHLAGPHIRPATAEDAAELAALHGASFTSGWSEAMIRTALELPGAGAFTLEMAGRALGFVQYQWVAGEAEVNTLCVAPAFRNQGFGLLLMQALLQDLRRRQTTRLHLEVAADNAAALRLYRKLGFEQTGLRKAYYARPLGPAVDALVLSVAP